MTLLAKPDAGACIDSSMPTAPGLYSRLPYSGFTAPNSSERIYGGGWEIGEFRALDTSCAAIHPQTWEQLLEVAAFQTRGLGFDCELTKEGASVDEATYSCNA
jgi:hypothetical protein